MNPEDYEVRGIIVLECPVCGKKTWADQDEDVPSHEHEWNLVGPVWFSQIPVGDPD